jgi:demethylmenaquinone methyltransferase/2-methoxy-6-polyprenyl-1,4-benzoquinol methylase
MSDPIEKMLREQIEYYRARASEYDEWFLRRGRYDRGPEANGLWFEEVATVRAALDRLHPTGDVLELACGTGLWTEQLLATARRITAVDTSPEVLELNRQRLHSPNVEYVQADLFAWRPEERYDIVFFGFWLSHIPPQRFDSFWQTVADSLNPGGRVFFVDSKYEPASTARDHTLGSPDAAAVLRRLNDGREYRIVKVFYKKDELQQRLNLLGWDAQIDETPKFFLYGQATKISKP